MADFLDEKRQQITARLKELTPVVDEYSRLEAAASALARLDGSTSSVSTAATATAPLATRRRGPGRPRVAVNSTSAKPKAPAKPGRERARSAGRRTGRRKGSGRRATEALSFVQGQPGITISELAAKMGIQQNYLYRVLPGLEQEGKVEKKGRGWHPKS